MNNNRIKFVDNNTFELNIQPQASILNVFSRLSYKPWYALAEFVDNSTQSYISHLDEMELIDGFEKLVVNIFYDSKENILTIKDNAYGMEIDKFKDAILLDSKNEEQVGRNEFGMGLKTAASWFGNKWSVESTQYGSKNEYYAIIDIQNIKKEDLNCIPIIRKDVDFKKHGTTIIIKDITKKITASRTIRKIKDLLSSMYRRDINNKNIEIWFNNEQIKFEDYPILKNFRDKEWKKNLNFNVEFNDYKYQVKGFVAIMNPGSFSKAGFALFRQDRVVIGGTDSNYKPTQIFGQAQSQRSLKLFGELDLNSFPVNQAKDGFVWDDGLEDSFIQILKDNIQEYIEIADLSIKQRESETQFSDEKSENLYKRVSEAINSMKEKSPFSNEFNNFKDLNQFNNKEEYCDDKEEYIETILKTNRTESKCVGKVRNYDISINKISNQIINVQWEVGNNREWIKYDKNEKGEIDVEINMDHPFFIPYSQDDNFKVVLEKFVLAFIMAEVQARHISDKDGYIKASTIKYFMNDYLSKLAGVENGKI